MDGKESLDDVAAADKKEAFKKKSGEMRASLTATFMKKIKSAATSGAKVNSSGLVTGSTSNIPLRLRSQEAKYRHELRMKLANQIGKRVSPDGKMVEHVNDQIEKAVREYETGRNLFTKTDVQRALEEDEKARAPEQKRKREEEERKRNEGGLTDAEMMSAKIRRANHHGIRSTSLGNKGITLHGSVPDDAAEAQGAYGKKSGGSRRKTRRKPRRRDRNKSHKKKSHKKKSHKKSKRHRRR